MRIGCVFLAFLSLNGQTQQTGGLSPNLAFDEKERALGAQLASELRQRTSILTIPSADDYLGLLSSRIIAQFPGTHPTCVSAVIGDDTLGGVHEPIALLGGYLFVPAMLFRESRSEAEFAGMLAHAVAHLALNHAGIQSGFPTLHSDGSVFPLKWAQKQRALEREADIYAIQVMAKAGYDPQSLIDYIGREQPVRSGGRVADSPLPLRDSRVGNMQRIIDVLPIRAYHSGTEFMHVKEEVERAVAK